MPIHATLTFEPTRAGFAKAHAELDRYEAETLGSADTRVEVTRPSLGRNHAVIAVYAGTGEGTRTRELLDVLPGGVANALTPSEIGDKLTPNDDGSPYTAAQVRAVMRNEKRVEKTIRKRGLLPPNAEVVRAVWAGYDAERSGRYYVLEEDRAILDQVKKGGA